MTKEEKKELLLKDICARLPYNCQVFYEYVDNLDGKTYGYSLTLNTWCIDELVASKAVIKPYLRPLSSMTEEEKEELRDTYDWVYSEYPFDDEDEDEDDLRDLRNVEDVGGHYEPSAKTYDWYNRKGFDYRGLIPKGLALEAKEGMYN